MTLHPNFPDDPHAILDPAVRWFPAVVADYLEGTYPDLQDAVLVIHAKNNGEISEATSGKSKEELEELRKQANEIDDSDSPYKAIVSVLVLNWSLPLSWTNAPTFSRLPKIISVLLKMVRLRQWCEDVNRAQQAVRYVFVFVDEEGFRKYRPTSFTALVHSFRDYNG